MTNLTTEVEAGDWQSVADLEQLVQRATKATLPKTEARSIHVLFTNDMEMRAINSEWRGHDKPTNVLSFPSADQPVPKGEVAHLGDLVLAWETVSSEATTQGKTTADHVSHLIVHGLLHLQGFDHETETDGDAMEARETEILASLGIADPYAS
jgi:probable rRNA maturation factor